jgi:hypothetical protein
MCSAIDGNNLIYVYENDFVPGCKMNRTRECVMFQWLAQTMMVGFCDMPKRMKYGTVEYENLSSNVRL